MNSQIAIKRALRDLQNGSGNVETCYAILSREYEAMLRLKLQNMIDEAEKAVKKSKREEDKLEKQAVALRDKEKTVDDQIRKLKELNAFSRIDVSRESLDNEVKTIYTKIDKNKYEILIESGDLPDYRIGDILKRRADQELSQQYFLDLRTFCKKFRKIVSRLTMMFEESAVELLNLPYSMLLASKNDTAESLPEKVSKTISDTSSSLSVKTDKIMQMINEEQENSLGVFNHATINDLYWKLENNADLKQKASEKLVEKLLVYCPVFLCVDKTLNLMKNNPDVDGRRFYYAFFCKYIKPNTTEPAQQLKAFQSMSGIDYAQSSFYQYAEKGMDEFVQILFFYLDIFKNYEDEDDIRMIFRELIAFV